MPVRLSLFVCPDERLDLTERKKKFGFPDLSETLEEVEPWHYGASRRVATGDRFSA